MTSMGADEARKAQAGEATAEALWAAGSSVEVVEFDSTGRILRCTAAFAAAAGEADPQSLLGRHASEIEGPIGLDRLVASVVASGSAIHNVDLPSASTPHALHRVTILPLHGDDGSVGGSLYVGRDLTDLMEAKTEADSLATKILQPPPLPDIPGLDVAVAARPADPVFGGDTYGIFPSPDGTWTALIADVAGSGRDAAPQTTLIRNAVHGLATAINRPRQVLGVINRLLLDEETAERLCSAVVARLRPVPAGLRITMASAGHPYPVVVRADGSFGVFRPDGILLGAAYDPCYHDEVTSLDRNDVMVLYTDGLLAAWDRNPVAATGHLVRAVQERAEEAASAIATGLLDDLHPVGGRDLDDATVLVIKVS